MVWTFATIFTSAIFGMWASRLVHLWKHFVWIYMWIFSWGWYKSYWLLKNQSEAFSSLIGSHIFPNLYKDRVCTTSKSKSEVWSRKSSCQSPPCLVHLPDHLVPPLPTSDLNILQHHPTHLLEHPSLQHCFPMARRERQQPLRRQQSWVLLEHRRRGTNGWGLQFSQLTLNIAWHWCSHPTFLLSVQGHQSALGKLCSPFLWKTFAPSHFLLRICR